jgi:hypothetical protein
MFMQDRELSVCTVHMVQKIGYQILKFGTGNDPLPPAVGYHRENRKFTELEFLKSLWGLGIEEE